MLAPFTPDEVALLERSDFQHHAAASPQLRKALHANDAVDDDRPVSNGLGDEHNRELLDALHAFLASNPSDADRRTAQQLVYKIGAALDAAERP